MGELPKRIRLIHARPIQHKNVRCSWCGGEFKPGELVICMAQRNSKHYHLKCFPKRFRTFNGTPIFNFEDLMKQVNKT